MKLLRYGELGQEKPALSSRVSTVSVGEDSTWSHARESYILLLSLACSNRT
jgi:hypothetical protein